MTYDITRQRQQYLDARGYTILMACPGSGKTTSIVYKLKQLTEELHNHSRFAGVACLSYTNAACVEYHKKYKELHGNHLLYPHIFSTLDSFISQFIVLPYAYLLKLPERLRIIDDAEILSRLYKICNDRDNDSVFSYVKTISTYGQLPYHKQPEQCEFDIDGYRWKGNILSDDNEIRYCKTCVKYRFSKGIITSHDAAFIAYHLLKTHRHIAKALAQRFPYIIVDEAQDTTFLQFEILKILREEGIANMEFVGDVFQSIYEWNNARPDILKSYAQSEQFTLLQFTECRRSVQSIIDIYSSISEPNAPRIESFEVEDQQCPITIYRYGENVERSVIYDFYEQSDRYNLSSKLVLFRGNEAVAKVMGFSKNVFPWKNSVAYDVINAQVLIRKGDYSCGIDLLRRVWAKCACSTWEEEHQFVDNIRDDVDKNALLLELSSSLPDFNHTIQDWQSLTEETLQTKLQLSRIIDFKRKTRMKDMPPMSTFINERMMKYWGIDDDDVYKDRIDACTIHQVKGASVDAVLLFLSTSSQGDTISLADFPNHGSRRTQPMKEKHRLIYVACSRAKQFLALAVPDIISEDEIYRKFGRNIAIRSIGVQTNLF